MPKVYGINLSPFVRKLRVVLAEKNIGYQLEPVFPFGMSEEMVARSPARKIPVLEEDDGYTLPDTSCIALYLERTRPTPALLPSDDKEYGRALFYDEYGDTKVAEAVLVPFVERIVNARFSRKDPDEARIASALSELVPPVFDHLETLVGDGEGIVGGRFSLADIAVCSPIVNFGHGGESIDAARWPKLAAYVERVHARPSFKAVIEEERKDLAG